MRRTSKPKSRSKPAPALRRTSKPKSRSKSAPASYYPVSTVGDGGWFSVVREPFTGAWQRNIELRAETVLAYSAVYACVTLIASDISKIGLRLVEQDDDGIWTETKSPSFSPVLRKPNPYQNRIQFIEQWVISKLLKGNAYILKEYDARKVVTAMYVLDPMRTKALVGPDGEVYYDLSADNLSGIADHTVVGADQIIHDKMVPLYHPLCGVSPLTACGLAAMQGLSIQHNSAAFFQNGSRPSGILTAPGRIDEADAKRLKAHLEEGFSGRNSGRVAVMGDGLKYEPMTMNAVDAQLIDQLKWSAETVCSCFHVPPYMIGVGQMPTYNNIEALNQQYYQQCLQAIIESIELCLDEGLGLAPDNINGKTYGTEFDLEDLLRMDTATKVRTAAEGLKGIFTTNEARKKFDLKPKTGGDAVLVQQQNFSIEAIAKRDAKDDPFATAAKPAAASSGADQKPANDNATEEEISAAAQIAYWKLKSLLAA